MVYNNNTFLEAYKKLETILKNNNIDIKDYETKLLSESDSDTYNKFRICRLVRNYLSHETLNFIYASPEMTKFINSQIIKLDKNQISVTKKMNKKFILENECFNDAVSKTLANKYSPIMNKKQTEIIGYLSRTELFNFLSKNSSLKNFKVIEHCIKQPSTIKFISSDTLYSEIIDDLDKYTFIIKNNDLILGWL